MSFAQVLMLGLWLQIPIVFCCMWANESLAHFISKVVVFNFVILCIVFGLWTAAELFLNWESFA